MIFGDKGNFFILLEESSLFLLEFLMACFMFNSDKHSEAFDKDS